MILLTGASGFIGKRLLHELIKNFGKDNVVALTSAPLENEEYILHNNYSFSNDYFTKNGFDRIETIIHAGAFTPKNGSQANLLESNTNICNTEKLLQSDLSNLRKFIFLSTLDVYANTAVLNEASETKPATLYGWSKLYCEKMIESWSAQTGIQHQILRIGHVYGPGEEAYQKIIPATINNILNGNPVQIWGDGSDIRSFIYIDDVISSIIKSLDLAENIGPVNLVSENQISIKNLIDKIITIDAGKVDINIIPSNNPVRNFVFDNSKLKKYLLPNEYDLDKGLSNEYNYMKQLR